MKPASQHRTKPAGKIAKVGRKALPNSRRTFNTRAEATVVNERIDFHGAKLTVEVFNAHLSRLFRSKKVTIAPDRLVALREGEIECRVGTNTVRIRLADCDRGEEPPFSAFPNELPRRLLKKIPILIETDRSGRFVGLTIFRERPEGVDGGRRRRVHKS